MEMEKAFYVVTFKPSYYERVPARTTSSDVARPIDGEINRVIVSITQGGFGQDVVDDERQAKERFLEYLFYSSDVDLPRTVEMFDQYFELEQAGEFIDLDEEL
ncbi:MAG TPA: hypothetical protein VLE20_04155 [Blastocatellia bacterium]|jgi:hypothetical protein|nr:hypothetical protein [Blastocatellia bacterium]